MTSRKRADPKYPPRSGKENITQPVFASPRSAVEALSQIQEWGKWMAGIQTAALGGLGAILLEARKPGACLSDGERTCAFLSFLFLSLGLLFSSWVLSSVASISLRLGLADTDRPAPAKGEMPPTPLDESPGFDIYEWPSFPWVGGNRVSLGLLMGAQHWSWFIGLVLLAAFCIQFFR